MRPQRVEILGVPVDCVDMQRAGDFVDEILTETRQECVLAVNSEKVLRARDDPALLACLQSAGLLIPDGIGAVLAVRILHGLAVERVPGADLMPLICQSARKRDASIFLFGAKPEVNQRTRDILAKQFPGLTIAGNRDGYVADHQMPGLIADINRSGAEVLFVALGSPRQEFWIAKHKGDLQVKLIQGVGGSFDVISGYVRRAPAFFRRAHLEWLYRVIAQPSKLPRAWINIRFGLKVLRARFGWG